MILNDSSSSWVWLAKVIRMVLLESAIELNPSARGHRSPFEFQVTHIGYGESWEKYSVVDAYLMKNSHPNNTFPCGRSKSFTGLMILCFKQPRDSMLIDNIPCEVPRYRTDEEMCRL